MPSQQVPAEKKVSFGKTTVIPMTRKRITQTYKTVQAKWYTESELLLIEVENKGLVQRFGMSRGLELVYDEVCGQQMEAFQVYHSDCILALQRKQVAAVGMHDESSLRKLSMAITQESSRRAQERGIHDFMDAAGIVMFDIEIPVAPKKQEIVQKRSMTPRLTATRSGAAA